MPPAKKKECSVVLFDVNSSEEYKIRALKAYDDICGRKFFLDIEDLTQLILVNTDETKNSGNDEFPGIAGYIDLLRENEYYRSLFVFYFLSPGKYEHIIEATDMVGFDLIHRNHILEAKSGVGNWLEAVLLGTDILEKKSEERGVYTLQLLLFSDLKTPLQMKDKTVEKMIPYITSKLKDTNTYIFVLGPEVDIPSMLKSKTDILNWMQNVQLKNSEDDSSNYQIAKRLVQGAKGIICDLDIGADLFTVYKRHKGKQPWLVPLKFYDLEIPSVTSKIIQSDASVRPTEIIEGIQETFYVDVEDESRVITEELVDGLAIFDKLIIIPRDVDSGIKTGERCFKLLGFTDAADIPDHYIKSTATNKVMVDAARNPNAKALDRMIRAAHNLNLYGVAQKVHMANCQAKLFCLIPQIGVKSAYFIMPELEYAEGYIAWHDENDIHDERFQVTSEKHKSEVYNFLDSIDGSDKIKLHPNLRADLYNKKMFTQFGQKYLGQEIIKSEMGLGDLYVQPSGEGYEKLLSIFEDSKQ